VLITPAYFSTRENSGLEPYVGKVMQPAKDVCECGLMLDRDENAAINILKAGKVLGDGAAKTTG